MHIFRNKNINILRKITVVIKKNHKRHRRQDFRHNVII